MVDIEKLDDVLYKSIYVRPRTGDYNEIWSRIKSNPEVLREAVQVKRDKFDEHDIVKGLTICDSILIDYNSVDKVAYNNLINSIYTNIDIARIVMDGASNGGYSFLLMSLWNHNLKLTEEQKTFAVNEAMNKIGTTRWQQMEEEFSKKLDDKGISDDNTAFIDIDGCINPIGQKSGLKYMNYKFSALSTTQAHGTGEFDIRYQILRNPNWSLDEKQKLIMNFWSNEEAYAECLEHWEWGIPYLAASNSAFQIEEFDLYECSYEWLLMICDDKKVADRIWSEIQFCKQMRELRSPQSKLEFTPKKKTLLQTNIKD